MYCTEVREKSAVSCIKSGKINLIKIRPKLKASEVS